MEAVVRNKANSKHFFQWRRPDSKIEIYWEDLLLASTEHPVLLKEFGREMYDGAYYIPEEDINTAYLFKMDKHTYCPIKGGATYYSLKYKDEVVEEIAWAYREPIPESQMIKGHIAFYLNKVKFIMLPK